MSDRSPRVAAKGFRGLLGVARVDITPPVGIRNRHWGAATVDVGEGIHRPFALTTLAIADADRAGLVLLVAVDGADWRRVDDWERLQERALPALELGPEQLLVNFSHTHSGPDLCAAHADLPGGELIGAYMEALTTAVVDAGREAIAALAPGAIDWTTGRCDVAVNRDLYLEDRALVGFNPEVAADDTVLVGRATRADGSALATIVNYACHPTTLGWENHDLSPDYIGALRETVEGDTGALCLFFQGASGDLSPRIQYVGDTAVADRHGRAIGLAVLAALATMPPPATDLVLLEAVESGAPLAIWGTEPADLPGDVRLEHRVVELPLRPLETEQELATKWAGIPPQSRDERLRRVRDKRAGYIDLECRPDSVDHPLWAAKIGDALVIAHPGEAYSFLQTELRRRLGDAPVLVMNLTNGPGFAYLPDGRAYERDAYAAWQTVLERGALEQLVDSAHRTLLELIR